MAAIMINAAAMAYRKAAAKTRRAVVMNPDIPPWLHHVASYTKDDDVDIGHTENLRESSIHRKERLFSQSERRLERLAWNIHIYITSTLWFDLFVLFNILAVGITTGLELESKGNSNIVLNLASFIGDFTLGVFTIECFVKILSEAYEPWRYFIDEEYGSYNTFDFLIVFFSYVFYNSNNGEGSALKMLRLVRLLTFIKYVRELRVLVSGLISGVKSVTYICMLLFLVIYIFAIIATLMFGENDPAHFGDVAISMLSLFQVSTLASWTSIAYISWFGCEEYQGSAYDEEHPSRIRTMAGVFEGFKCDVSHNPRAVTGAFFVCYIVTTSWVIMSLFIGVISMGMFETFIENKTEDNLVLYAENHARNTLSESGAEVYYKNKIKKTLKYKIDFALNDASFRYDKSRPVVLRSSEMITKYCKKITDSTIFNLIIAFFILVVAGMTGYETNLLLQCNRMAHRLENNQDDNYDAQDDEIESCENSRKLILNFLHFFTQGLFTFEAMIKIIAEGYKPWKYFTKKQEGSWNCIDFFVVLVGFLEYTQAIVIFKKFPIVLLRLLRLLRVARLAKTFHRLRALVEALVSAFSSVGWITLFFAVFNYIAACLCMIIFQDNDPFHFASVARSMFTIFRMETLDTWDQILYINMFGCAKYPAGYEFLTDETNHNHYYAHCLKDDSQSFGWIGAFIIFSITIVGAYILPVVLIGIVSIKFDESSKYVESLEEAKAELKKALKFAHELVPDFFTKHRIEAIQDVFNDLDSSGGLTLDLQEAAPFFQYVIAQALNVELTSKQYEELFYVVDTSLTSEIGMGEFVQFIAVFKKVQRDHELALTGGVSSHGKVSKGRKVTHHLTMLKPMLNMEELNKISQIKNNENEKMKSIWDKAMERSNKDDLDIAWDLIFRAINGIDNTMVKKSTLSEKIQHLFQNIDADHSMQLDLNELENGLRYCGIHLSKRQCHSLANSLDVDHDGSISFEEFAIQAQMIKNKREDIEDLQDYEDMLNAIKHFEENIVNAEKNSSKLMMMENNNNSQQQQTDPETKEEMSQAKEKSKQTSKSYNASSSRSSSGGGGGPQGRKFGRSSQFSSEKDKLSKARDEKLIEITKLYHKKKELSLQIMHMKQEIRSLEAEHEGRAHHHSSFISLTGVRAALLKHSPSSFDPRSHTPPPPSRNKENKRKTKTSKNQKAATSTTGSTNQHNSTSKRTTTPKDLDEKLTMLLDDSFNTADSFDIIPPSPTTPSSSFDLPKAGTSI